MLMTTHGGQSQMNYVEQISRVTTHGIVGRILAQVPRGDNATTSVEQFPYQIFKRSCASRVLAK